MMKMEIFLTKPVYYLYLKTRFTFLSFLRQSILILLIYDIIIHANK